MRTTTAQDSKAKKQAPANVQFSQNELIRMLVGRAETILSHEELNGDGNGSKPAPSERVLLDVDLEGARYLLVRMPKDDHKVQLSPREQEIVRMVSQGHPNKVIADVLNISSWTVCTHLRRIFAKLGVGTRAAMVARVHGTVPVGASASQSSTRRMAVGTR